MKSSFLLIDEHIRQNAIACIRSLPADRRRPFVIDIRTHTRTLAQNRMLWACLSDIAEQVTWYDRQYSPESWKHIFSASLKGQESAQGLNGEVVVLGKSTSRMSVAEMRDLITLIHAFGAQHDVRFSDEAARAKAWAERWGK